jgi:hypothetical protein
MRMEDRVEDRVMVDILRFASKRHLRVVASLGRYFEQAGLPPGQRIREPGLKSSGRRQPGLAAVPDTVSR